MSWRLIRAAARGKSQVRHLSKIVSSPTENHNCSDFKKFLVTLDMSFVDGFTCLESQCKLCSINSPGSLYINKTTGMSLVLI